MKQEVNSRKLYFEYGYLACLAVTVLISFLETTMFEQVKIPSLLSLGLRMALTVFVLVKLFFGNDYWDKPDAILCALASIILLLCCFFGGWSQLIAFVCLMVGARGVDDRKIMKVFFLVTFMALLYTVLMALTGSIQNLVYYQASRGTGNRIAFGMDYPTNFTAHLFFLGTVYLWMRKKAQLWETLVLWGLAFAAWRYCDARMDTICLALLGCSSLVKWGTRKAGKQWSIPYGLQAAAMALPWILASASILISFFYDENIAWMVRINEFLSGRLDLGKQAFERYSVSIFGQAITLTGFERTTVYPIEYFYLDSSYVKMFFCFGILGTIVSLCLITWCIYKEMEEDNSEHILIWVLVCLQCMIEPHLMETAYHPLFFTAFAGLPLREGQKEKEADKKRALLTFTIMAAVFAAAFGIGKIRLGKFEAYDNNTMYYARDAGIDNTGTDCTRELQGLIDQVYLKGGGRIVLESGTYAVSGLNLRSYVSLAGEGMKKTVIRQLPGEGTDTGQEEKAFVFCSRLYNRGISLSDLTLEGSGEAGEVPVAGLAFGFDYSDGSDAYADEGSQRGEHAKHASRIRVTGFSGDGIQIGIGRSDIYLENAEISSNGGIGLNIYGTGNEASGIRIYDNAKSGLQVAGDENSFYDIISSGNGKDDMQYWGIYLHASSCLLDKATVNRNSCGGISIVGNDNQVLNVISDSNGVPEQESESVLIFLQGERNILSGKCRQTIESAWPYAEYSLIMSDCKECQVAVEIAAGCSRLGEIADQDQLVG